MRIQADTICIHGDTPSALQILQYLSKELPKHNIVLSK
ncbi:MAG: LamB/YcsF family protein [Bacteroidota bacterium]